MFEGTRKISIFCGNLGSGKTEISINYSLILKKQLGKPTNLIDIDIVNPYFRSRLMKNYLSKKGVNVICPIGELAGADVPALPPAILGVIKNPDVYGVFDVGGDDVGATVLGRFKPYLYEGVYNLFFVVNANRPFTGSVEGIIKYLSDIQKVTRLNITALVNNTNLGLETGLNTIVKGHKMISQVAQKLNIPIAFVTALRAVAGDVEKTLNVKVLPLDLHMQPPWNYDGDLISNNPGVYKEKFFCRD